MRILISEFCCFFVFLVRFSFVFVSFSIPIRFSFLGVGVERLDELLLVRIHSDLAAEVLAGLSFLLDADDLDLLGHLLSGLLQGNLLRSLLVLEILASQLSASQCLGVRVQLQHDSEVAQRILLVWRVFHLASLRAEMRLDLRRVDDAAEI
jgi:hypothetical protein